MRRLLFGQRPFQRRLSGILKRGPGGHPCFAMLLGDYLLSHP